MSKVSTEAITTLVRFVPETDLRTMTVVQAAPFRYLPSLLKMSAVTLGYWVIFRAGRYDETTPRGLALIAHESVHIGQARKMGRPVFLIRYLIGQFQCGFKHDKHPLEMPAIAVQQTVRRELENPTV